jgi:hypothetical protein
MISQAASQPALTAAASLKCPIQGKTCSTPSRVGGAMLTQISLFEGVLDFKPPFPDILLNQRRGPEVLPSVQLPF